MLEMEMLRSVLSIPQCVPVSGVVWHLIPVLNCSGLKIKITFARLRGGGKGENQGEVLNVVEHTP